MQQLTGMTQGTVSEHLRAQPLSSDGSPDNTFTNFNASVCTTSDFSHRKWIRVPSGRQSATLQKQRANPSLSGTLVVPSRPRHEITVSSSKSCNQQSVAHRLEPRTALGTLLLLNTTQVPGVTPGYLNTSIELHWRCSRTLRSIKGLFLIQRDLLPETAEMSREPEEAATPLQRTPLIKGNPCPRSLHSRLREQQRAPAPRAPRLTSRQHSKARRPPRRCHTQGQHSKAGRPLWWRYTQGQHSKAGRPPQRRYTQGQHSKAGRPPRRRYTQAPPPADRGQHSKAGVHRGVITCKHHPLPICATC